jgi:hypothetical protein
MTPQPSESGGGQVHVTFLVNFFEELRRKAPLNGK